MTGDRPTAERLAADLASLRADHAVAGRDPALAATLARLRGWQSRRLRGTYADLARSPRYAEAISFFESDLYGPGDASRRDADLARIVPVATKMLPAGMLEVVADATELNACSSRLDGALAAALPAGSAFGVADYCRAYRAADDLDGRHRQIVLIGIVGRAIDHYGRKRAVRETLHLMRRPARIAGFGALQDFLERGLASFARMDGADEFLATVDAREKAILEAIVAGSDAPVPDPGWPA
jgi:hypothetical protein